MSNLTPKQERFVQEYLIDFNGTQAAIRAGYSKKTACSIGAENLRKPQIQEILQFRAKEVAKTVGLTQEDVVDELRKIVKSDIRSLYDEDGVLLPVNKWPDDMAGAIAGMESIEIEVEGKHIGNTKKLKLWDKNSAIGNAMKYLRMLGDDKAGDININTINYTENRLEGARRIAFVLALGSGKMVK